MYINWLIHMIESLKKNAADKSADTDIAKSLQNIQWKKNRL